MMVKKRYPNFAETIASILTVISLIIALLSWLWPSFTTNTSSTNIPQTEQDLKAQVVSLRTEVGDLKMQIARLSNLTPESELNIRLGSVEASITGLDGRLTKIENVILKDPSEVLELPLLKQQLTNDEKNDQDEINRLNADIDRLYSILVGSLVALLITILGPRLLDVFKKDQEQKTSVK